MLPLLFHPTLLVRKIEGFRPQLSTLMANVDRLLPKPNFGSKTILPQTWAIMNSRSWDWQYAEDSATIPQISIWATPCEDLTPHVFRQLFREGRAVYRECPEGEPTNPSETRNGKVPVIEIWVVTPKTNAERIPYEKEPQ
jgi:hypothetical protein